MFESSPSKPVAITLIAICQVAAMALWFSASAVVPALVAEYKLSSFAQALLTSGVQAGFVVGSLTSAILSLADRIEPRRFFMISAAIASIANALILVVEPAGPLVPVLRFITGMCMAGIYPVGMKLAATWARGDMGLMVCLPVGALTLRPATPHLCNALGGIDRRTTLTMLAMLISGSCGATVGLLFGGNPWLLSVVCLLWGVSIVADSAQFSASIAELSDRAYVGTMLTLQTALGFTLTLVTIHLMPAFVTLLGWRAAFVPL